MASPQSQTKTVIKPLDDRIVVTRSSTRSPPPAASSHPRTPRRSRSRPRSWRSAWASCSTTARAPSPMSRSAETILFGKYDGTELTVDGVDVIILARVRHPRQARLSARRPAGNRSRPPGGPARPLPHHHHNTLSPGTPPMAKQLLFGEDARRKILIGIQTLNDAVKVTMGPDRQGRPPRCPSRSPCSPASTASTAPWR